MKQYRYLVTFSCAPSGIGSAYIMRTSKLDSFDKLGELAQWIGDTKELKNVCILGFQLVNVSRVKKEKK